MADPFGDLDVQHEVVHMFLSFVQCQLLCYDCDQHGGACYTHDSGEETHRLAAAGVRCHIAVAHSEEGDRYEPQSCFHVAGGGLGLPAGGRKKEEFTLNAFVWIPASRGRSHNTGKHLLKVGKNKSRSHCHILKMFILINNVPIRLNVHKKASVAAFSGCFEDVIRATE